MNARPDQFGQQRRVRSETNKNNDTEKTDTVELRLNITNQSQIEIDDIENEEAAIALSQQAVQA